MKKSKYRVPLKYVIPNPDNNELIDKYNEICLHGESGTSLHHIMPRCKYPELKEDKSNHVYLSLNDHYYAHYYLWKADRIYALEFWFVYVYFHKNFGYNMSDEEYEQLKEDCNYCRRLKKENRDEK